MRAQLSEKYQELAGMPGLAGGPALELPPWNCHKARAMSKK
jgi:hypothetical protein